MWQRELRDLTRMRARFSQELTQTSNRILKVLEDAQIKLDCVASDAMGVSGRLILNALVEENRRQPVGRVGGGKAQEEESSIAKGATGDVPGPSR
jgi:transposase